MNKVERKSKKKNTKKRNDSLILGRPKKERESLILGRKSQLKENKICVYINYKY